MDGIWLENLKQGTRFVFGPEPLDIATLLPTIRHEQGGTIVSRHVKFPHQKTPLRLVYDDALGYIICRRASEYFLLSGRCIDILPPL